jgi:hypothetical protein
MNNTGTSISNAALSHLGVTSRIADLDTDKSKEAVACRTFFDQVRAEILRDFAWPFASKIVVLEKVADSPNQDWAYSYRVPSDKSRCIRILNGISRFETRDTRIPFKLSNDSQGPILFTDQPDAQLEYIFDQEDLSYAPADFNAACSLLLASYIGPQVMAGDKYNLRRTAFEMYQVKLSFAETNAANEEQNDPPAESEFITVRG